MSKKSKPQRAEAIAFVQTGTGPIRMRKSGAGFHANTTRRQRTRGQARSAALQDQI